MITLQSGTSMALDNMSSSRFLSLGKIAEDGIEINRKIQSENSVDDDTNVPNENETDKDTMTNKSVLDKINGLYCDKEGRPYTDIRVKKALIIHDPYPDPEGMDELLIARGMTIQDRTNEVNDNEDTNDDNKNSQQEHSSVVISSPQRIKPLEEVVPERMSTEQIDQFNKEYEITPAEQYELLKKKEAKSRAVVLEMLGDLPSADVKAPENVLFVCKLNPVTQDEDLDLIFSRFDPNAKTEIIRDMETGQSLNYAFVEFTTKEQCTEAYLKMNNALVDDRRIKVDFSQSVSKEWNKYTQQMRGRRKQYAHNMNNGYTSRAQQRYPMKKNESTGHHRYHDRSNTSRNKDNAPNIMDNHDKQSNHRENYDCNDNNQREGIHQNSKANDAIYSSDEFSYRKHRRRRKHSHRKGKHESRKSSKHDRDRINRSHRRRSSHDSLKQNEEKEDDSYESVNESNERRRRRNKHARKTNSRKKRYQSSSSHHHFRDRSRSRSRSQDRYHNQDRSRSRSISGKEKHNDGKKRRHRA